MSCNIKERLFKLKNRNQSRKEEYMQTCLNRGEINIRPKIERFHPYNMDTRGTWIGFKSQWDYSNDTKSPNNIPTNGIYTDFGDENSSHIQNVSNPIFCQEKSGNMSSNAMVGGRADWITQGNSLG